MKFFSKFNSIKKCPKCGSEKLRTTYFKEDANYHRDFGCGCHRDREYDHLHRRCSDCMHWWPEECLDEREVTREVKS